jgi:hypothetical protein
MTNLNKGERNQEDPPRHQIIEPNRNIAAAHNQVVTINAPVRNTNQLYEPRYVLKFDGSIVTNDVELNKNSEVLYQFILNQCYAPGMTLTVKGYYSYSESYTDSDGNSQSKITTTDEFVYHSDLSQYVKPNCVLRPNVYGKTVHEVLDEYTSESNWFKSFTFKKIIHWNQEMLRSRITSAIRSSGYKNDIAIYFDNTKSTLLINSGNAMANIARHTFCQILCMMSCLWVIFLPLYNLCKEDFQTLEADFQMGISPEEWYNANINEIMDVVRQRKITC